MPTYLPLLATEAPPWLDRILQPAALALLVFVAAWIVLALISRWHKKTYNLTKAETRPVQVKDKPAFLKVDHEARAEAIARGDAYVRPDDAAAAAEEAPQAAQSSGLVGRFLILVRIATLLFAATNLCLMIGSCLNLMDGPNEDFASLPAVDRWRIIINEYWLPLITSLAVLSAQVIAFLRSERKKNVQNTAKA